MMRRVLSWGALAGLAVVSPVALGLSIGAPEVASTLDAPLQARLPLTGLGDIDPSLIRVHIADRAAFAEAGIPRTTLVESIATAIARQAGTPAVVLSTQQPVREPYLDFLLTLEWPGGQQRREVTLLLDPPGYASMPALQPSPNATTVTASPDAVPSRDAPAEPAASPTRLTVTSGDTLWQLADRVRPEGASMEQTLLALQRANPEAFVDGDIDALRAGATLSVPSAQAIRDQVVEAAERRAREPNRGGAEKALAATAEPTAVDAVPRKASGESGRLRVLGDRELDAPPPASTLSAASIEAARRLARETRLDTLESRLRTTQQQLADARAQRRELSEQLTALSTQLNALRQRLEAPDTASAGQSSSSASVSPDRAPSPSAPDAVSAGWLSQWRTVVPWLGGGALLLLLAGLVGLRRRARREARDASRARPFPMQGAPSYSQHSDAAPAEAPGAEMPAPEDARGETLRAEVINEADIYMAYGRYDEARERLERSLAREPERSDLRLKLLAALVALGDRTAASREATRLQRDGDVAQREEARALLARVAPGDREAMTPVTPEADAPPAEEAIPTPTPVEPESEPGDARDSPADGEGRDDSRVIDYQPPRLDPEAVTDRAPHLDLPIVEFPLAASGDEAVEPAGTGSGSRADGGDAPGVAGAEEAGWVLEEVAFDPLDLDNDRSMAPAPASRPQTHLRHNDA